MDDYQGAHLMGREPTPTIQRWRLGQELERHRVAAGLDLREAARELEISTSTVSKIEGGRQTVKPIYIKLLANLYGLTDGQREELLELANRANQPEWFVPLAKSAPAWFRQYLGYEAAASVIQTYHAELVDGLLQTSAYTRAIALANRPDSTEASLEATIALRQGRQARVAAGGQVVHSVLGESVLRKRVGGAEVMRAQLQHLADLSELDTVTVQVLPDEVGEHPAMTAPFTLLGFADPWEGMTTVYLENGRGAVYLDARADLERYEWMFRRVCQLSLSPDESRERLRKVAADL